MQAEIKLQSDCFLWHWNTYPQERKKLCYNLNNSANKIQGNQNKSLGLIKGRCDMVYYKNANAIMIEFKTDKGAQSQDQIEWEKIITNEGFLYFVVRTLDEFKLLVQKILENNFHPKN
jgi:hypothetical protein